MSTSELSSPISMRARECLLAFESCLQGALTLGNRRHSALEDQMARFSIWTFNMAVFAAGKCSMDHRVREAPEVQRLVLGIIEVLHAYLLEYRSFTDRYSSLELTPEERRSLLAKGDIEHSMEAIVSKVALIHELSNTIRKAIRTSHLSKAETHFHIRDHDGNDIENVLREHWENNIRDRFPESSAALRHRLAASMVLRRKRILHRRSKYAMSPIKVSDPVREPMVSTRPAAPLAEDSTDLLVQPVREQLYVTVAPSRIPSVAKSATTLDLNAFKKVSAPSVVSHTKSTDMGSHEDLTFPPPPERKGVAQVTCPYCLYSLPRLDFTDRARWRLVV
ncbi:hypothetical protein GGR56DRAFT_242688 [Xylariaceae sp. FL0804]|nr:hypothetical protein GGR56DRAFT_242688 [Xylariaceae sp. FL0804]